MRIYYAAPGKLGTNAVNGTNLLAGTNSATATSTNAVFQEAPTVFGVWTNRPDLSSPFIMPIEKTGSRFYRLIAPGQSR